MTADRKQRDRAVAETNRSFAVEASAGTGKTTTLVERILHLVLEKRPSGQATNVSSICAITFTEKAAGEMKVRLRQEFEKRADKPGEEGNLARRALRDLETASISTFHSFAVSLLKERPIEAGLDPRFVTLDELQGNLFFREVWESWIKRALEERCAPLENALRQGIGLDRIYDLADTLRTRAHLIRRLNLVPPPSDEQLEEMRKVLLEESRQFSTLVLDSSDLLVAPLESTIAWLRQPDPAASPPGPGRGGRGGAWKGGKPTVDAVKDYIRRAGEHAAQWRQHPGQTTLHSLASWLIDDFLSEWDARKRANGYVDFDDQLEAARQLLLSNRAVRSDFQARYETLLVDEFQDTDQIQFEIVLLLSSTDLNERDPARLRADPGRLFIVGDPKQSIYRFRGADIETYLETSSAEGARALGLQRLELTTNFRSVPSILRFVDAAFSNVMKQEGHYQSAYLPFGDGGARSAEPASPAVYILGDRAGDGNLAGAGRDFCKIEAARIARLISKMKGNKDWSVEVPSREGKIRREAQFGDIAILLPVLSKVDLLENELRAAGIPYVLEGGKFYYARSEVASAISTLKAIANPNDQVALYSALRSIFFGLSDEDLLRARLELLPFDFRHEVPLESPLRRPYRILFELHRRRYERPASETFESLLQQTGAREVLAARGFQSLANLAKLARQLRALQEDAAFSEVVSLLGTIDEEEMAESESRLTEEHSNAVRILTIHKAKGLDFPVVILASAGVERGQHAVNFMADAHGPGKKFALKIGSAKDGWLTQGWEELKEGEKKRENAELLRLLYVALTRARDHLVISTHNKGIADKKSGLVKASFGKTRLAPLADFLNSTLIADKSLVRFLDTSLLDKPEMPLRTRVPSGEIEWSSILRREYEELDRLVLQTPHSLELHTPTQAEDRPAQDQTDAAIARDRAVRLGLAFHEAMERVDFGNPAGISRCAAEAGIHNRIDSRAIHKLEEMMQNCLSSSLIERVQKSAAAGRRPFRELPYLRPLASDQPFAGFEEGKIDLLFEERGGWVLVDYKTDSIPENADNIVGLFTEKYAAQIGYYISAVTALGLKVKEAYLLLARTGSEISIPIS